MSFPYIEENFISLSECQRLIDYATLNKSENVSRDDVYSTDIEWTDHGATYYGNNVDPITPEDNDEVVTKVTEKCKSLVDCQLGYVGIVRWPIGTFMKPHFDSNNVHTPNKVAARAEPFDTSKASAVLPSPEILTLPSALIARLD